MPAPITIDMKARRAGPRPKTQKAVRARRPADPTGRIDILASRLIGELAQSSRDPVIRALYRQLSPELDRAFHAFLGPRNPRARAVREYVRRGAGLLADIEREKRKGAA